MTTEEIGKDYKTVKGVLFLQTGKIQKAFVVAALVAFALKMTTEVVTTRKFY